MIRILEFEKSFAEQNPAALALLLSANLTVHPNVARVILHGSRGLRGGYRPDSDIDLSLIVDVPAKLSHTALAAMLQDVTDTTAGQWRSPVEADLAVVFDLRACGLPCFDQTEWNEGICQIGGVDCFGLYKTNKGFNGLVANAGVQVKQMYPCSKIWQRAEVGGLT